MTSNSINPFRYADLTYLEIRERAREGWLAILPTGCTEQQGPHLPVDVDTWLAESVSLAASERAAAEHGMHTLVLPAPPFGPTPEHRSFGSGYINLPAHVHDALVEAVLLSLAEQGFRRIVIWRGCGGHDLSAVVAGFNLSRAGEARAFLPAAPYHDVWCRIADPSVPGGHADSFTTSLALHLRPQSVRVELIPREPSGPIDWSDPDLDFRRYSETGVIGDPRHASAELGARLWEAVVSTAALILKTIAETPV